MSVQIGADAAYVYVIALIGVKFGINFTGTLFTRSPIIYISDIHYLDMIESHSLAKYSKISI